MKCGNCGGTDFSVAAGVAHCDWCGASVENEVAAALHAGAKPEHAEALKELDK